MPHLDHARVTAHGWFDNFSQAYAAEIGYVFLLSGNTSDLFPDDTEDEFVTLRQFWAKRLLGRKIAIFWNKSSGFAFADEIAGIDEPYMRDRYTSNMRSLQRDRPSADTAGLLGALASPGGADLFPTDPAEAFVLLEKILSLGEPDDRTAAVVIDYAESVLSQNDYTSIPAVALQRWASLDSPLKDTGNPVILIERNPERISETLKRDESAVVHIHIPRPNREELETFIRHTLESKSNVTLADDMTIEVIANLSTGLRCKDLDDFAMRSVEFDIPLSDKFIWQKKVELIKKQSGGVLEVIRPKHGFEAIGGLEYIKTALSSQINKLRNGSPTTDKGWLLMGPPGTGKTIVAEALAKESGVNFVVLGDIFSKFVGDTERNMHLAIDIAIAMAPTIIFIDEAAETIGNGEGYQGDSGVSSRVRGMLQNIMGDDSTRGQLFFMLATNYPDRLAPALLREGRIDKRVPLLVPDADGRRSILEALCRKYDNYAEELNFAQALQRTDGYTGAELEAILLQARLFAEERCIDDIESIEVTTEDIDLAIEDYIVSRDQQAFDLMTALAIRYTNSRRLLPPQYQQDTGKVNETIELLEEKVAKRNAHRTGNMRL